MNRHIFWVVTALVLLAPAMVQEAEARSIRAYFNGQEATVENVTLHVNETFTVDLDIVPDGDTIAYVLLTEPGTTRTYRRLGGQPFGEFVTVRCGETRPAHLSWTLAPNDRWVGGTAPLNVYCQLNRPGDSAPYASAYFTVVDTHIEAEEAVRPPPVPAGSPAELTMVAGALAAIYFKKRRMWKAYRAGGRASHRL